MQILFLREALDAADESGDVIRQFGLGTGGLGSSGDVHHAVAVAEIVEDMRNMLILRAGENIHVDAKQTETAGEFADVDIHPTGVLAAEDGKQFD